MPLGDLRHQRGRALEPTAQNHAECPAARQIGERVQPRQYAPRPALSLAESPWQAPMRLGDRVRVLIPEQVEHERPQTGAPRRLSKSASGLGRDQDSIALGHCGRGQPAISTASL